MTEPVTQDPLRRPAVLRLILCAGLFGLWMLYLGILVLGRTEGTAGTRLLSRPQALVSTFDVVAEIIDPQSGEAVLKTVLYPADRESLVETSLTITNLAACGSYRDKQFVADVTAPGTYLLLLHLRGEGLAGGPLLPPSPGFSRNPAAPRVYGATPDILGQYRQVTKPLR